MFFDSSDDDISSTFSRAYDDNAILAEGIHATIYKIDDSDEISAHTMGTGAGLRAIKSVSAFKNARLEPHDIRSEAFILARLSHPNIIQLLEASYSHQQKIYQITMPFIPLTLNDILENPNCSPYLLPQRQEALTAARPAAKTALEFLVLTKSFLYQIACALAFLHTREQPVAHRDLKPSNILVSLEGCIKLIDFGISWEELPRGSGASLQEPHGLHDDGRLNGFSDAPKPEWDETPEHMCCQVSSGPYRALELLFAPRRYDALALDMWSFGILASGFFTSLIFKAKEVGTELPEFDWDALIPEGTATSPKSETGTSADPDPDPTIPFNIPNVGASASGTWHRLPLFDSTRGEIGLIASIFKILGTPTDASWPGFNSLPAASALIFNPVSPRPLGPLLPNLPPSHAQPNESATGVCLADGENAVNLIQQMIRYPPEARMKASDLLRHAYFSEGCSLVLPSTHTNQEETSIKDGTETLSRLVSLFSSQEY